MLPGRLARKTYPFLSQLQVTVTSCRSMAEARKRFYRNVGVAGTNDSYEINLDHRKLKTPLGKVLQIPHYGLALAVAHEWTAVQEKIHPSLMHLTGLSFTVTDNPLHSSKWDVVDKMLDYLETDTILYREGSDDFMELLEREWDPLLEWFNTKFNVNLTPCNGICGANIPVEIREAVRRYFLSYDIWAVHGFFYGVEAIKSVVLAIAAAERKISVEKAVYLSRIETEYQASRWGSVEWAHDLEKYDLQSRFSAAMIFIQFNTWNATVKQKSNE
ncbi:ATP synthase mitochondrial F1 complex assembly factor 2 [Palaemon carinicauda]|uniref:ATP synthase mitochondrial F1 complex assembly factor 2 n=1 Tax=Palaemon carinicauda TaxID=392227 RepID=UPI0035B686CA